MKEILVFFSSLNKLNLIYQRLNSSIMLFDLYSNNNDALKQDFIVSNLFWLFDIKSQF
jgi:hypothetical protein